MKLSLKSCIPCLKGPSRPRRNQVAPASDTRNTQRQALAALTEQKEVLIASIKKLNQQRDVCIENSNDSTADQSVRLYNLRRANLIKKQINQKRALAKNLLRQQRFLQRQLGIVTEEPSVRTQGALAEPSFAAVASIATTRDSGAGVFGQAEQGLSPEDQLELAELEATFDAESPPPEEEVTQYVDPEIQAYGEAARGAQVDIDRISYALSSPLSPEEEAVLDAELEELAKNQ